VPLLFFCFGYKKICAALVKGPARAAPYAHSSRVILRHPTWVATTSSRPRRPFACSAPGFGACGVMRPFYPGATSSWTGAESSLACSRPPLAPRARVPTAVITSRSAACGGYAAIFAWSDLIEPRLGPEPQARLPAAAGRLRHARRCRLQSSLRDLGPLPRSVPGHRTRRSRQFVAGEPGRRCKALVSRVKCDKGDKRAISFTPGDREIPTHPWRRALTGPTPPQRP